MAETATSAHFRPQPHMSRPAVPSTATPTMAPFLSAQATSPSRHTSAPKTPSPNYFGFQVDGESYISDSPQYARNNWSSPSSAVRSAAALSPSVVPNDQNPSLDAFRRQSDSVTFNLSGLNTFKGGDPTSSSSPSSKVIGQAFSPRESGRSRTPVRDIPTQRSYRASLDPSSADLSRSPKRVLSPGSATESTRRGSPPTYSLNDENPPDAAANQPRFKLPLEHLNGSYASIKQSRAAAAPTFSDVESKMMITPDHIVALMDSAPGRTLLLDLRLATQYSVSHITSALSLCLPTTLLKRSTFTVKKLADTFKDEEQRRRFETWQQTSHIVVYDSSSALPKDAATCFHMVNKFRAGGYTGTLLVIKGGFSAFASQYPTYIEADSSSAMHDAAARDGDGPEVAPVVGGCPMPSTENPANPFFGNIRQNMDLIGGVGRIALAHPTQATPATEKQYPSWLKEASSYRDQGERVSHKFEQIEKREKKRMEEALSGEVVWNGLPRQNVGRAVQIAGLEQGAKNRYNNIWPFEHSRVKLQGALDHGCDYFNASHIQASASHKRYISTQAPIPATFNDFWNVVWQQDVRVVVMLTAEKEGAQVKAHNYWSQKQYGMLHLDFLSEKRASIEPARIMKHRKRPSTVQRTSTNSMNPQIPLATIDSRDSKADEQPFVVVRKFTLSHEKFPFAPIREITQLQYSNWPDFGAPTNPSHLLGLVEQCDAVVRVNSGVRTNAEPEPLSSRPVLVHCSAGCGRTGTFCTVDSVIDMLKRQRLTRTSSANLPEAKDSKIGAASSVRADGDRNEIVASDASSADLKIDGPWVHRDDQDLIEKTVEEFRHQRISMVQTLRQFVLCYETVMEWLVNQSHDEP